MLVTATGRDRIGFISDFATNVTRHNGNVLDVKAYKVNASTLSGRHPPSTLHPPPSTSLPSTPPPLHPSTLPPLLFSIRKMSCAGTHFFLV